MGRSVRAAAALATLGLAAACGNSGGSGETGAAGLSGQTITVYSGQHEETAQALATDFQKRTGVTVKLKSDDEASLAGQLLQEGPASPADVFFAENPPALTTVQEKNLLAPVDRTTLSQVPAADSSPKGDWVAVSARTAVLAVNTSLPAAQRPTSVYDLTGPAWKGKLGLAPSETDFSPVVTEVIKDKGRDGAKSWLEGLKANGKVYEDNETMIAAIDKGEIQGGIVDHYYWYRLRDEVGATKVHSALQYFAAGDPGAFIDVSAAAVLASSQHKAAAQAFLAYLVSQPAQDIIATSHSYEYPLRPGVTSKTDLKPLDSIGTVAAPSDLGDGKDALALMQEVGLL
jgi:iron(III) transport system substrate-binding protein